MFALKPEPPAAIDNLGIRCQGTCPLSSEPSSRRSPRPPNPWDDSGPHRNREHSGFPVYTDDQERTIAHNTPDSGRR